MATDAFEMALIHRVFRRELAHAPDLIRSVVAGDTKRSKVVSAHLCNVFSVLHHHHAAEDDQLWPTLRARLPLRVQDLARMQEEHTAIAESIAKVAAITTRWAATADPELAENDRRAERAVGRCRRTSQRRRAAHRPTHKRAHHR